MRRTILLAHQVQPGQRLRDHGGIGRLHTVFAVHVYGTGPADEVELLTSGEVDMHLPARMKVEVYQ